MPTHDDVKPVAEILQRSQRLGLVEHRRRWEVCQHAGGCHKTLADPPTHHYCPQCLTVYRANVSLNPPPMGRTGHKGYEVVPHVMPLEDGRFSSHVEIERRQEHGMRVMPVHHGETFATEGEAEARAIELGRAVIDGQVEGHSIDNLVRND